MASNMQLRTLKSDFDINIESKKPPLHVKNVMTCQKTCCPRDPAIEFKHLLIHGVYVLGICHWNLTDLYTLFG